MKKDSNEDLVFLTESSKDVVMRSVTPNELMTAARNRVYTPYPLYKQKIGALLKPPDYPRNPPKFMSVREPRSEFERKEASTQVKLLKKTFNTMYQRFNSVDLSLKILKSESIKINALRSVGENDIEHLKQRIQDLEAEENQMLNKIRDEYTDNTIYKHVRERMRQNLMHLEVKNQYLSGQIKLRDFLIESEHRKKIKTLENKFTKVQAFKQIKKIVNLDMKDRNADINILMEDIDARNKIHEVRKIRIKKYEEIAETAANEEREGKNNEMREILLSYMLWAKFLNFKFNFERKKFQHLENAFKRIKTETLIGNVSDVVMRFLMKEERLKELMMTLSKNRGKCINYLKKNDAMEAKIDDLLIIQKPGVDTNISSMKEKLHSNFLQANDSKKNLLRLKSCKESIKVWIKKELSKFSCVVKVKNPTLKDLYIALSISVRQKMKSSHPAFITEYN